MKTLEKAVPGESHLPRHLAATHCLERALASSHPSDPCPTSVYRYYDLNGLLIYVGITSRGVSRNREHNSDKGWWPFVHRQEVDHFPDRPAAAAAERALIRQYGPPFNTQHNPDHVTTRAAYLAFTASTDATETPRQMVQRYGNELPLHIADMPSDSGSTAKVTWLRTDPLYWPVADRIVRWQEAKATVPSKGRGAAQVHSVEKRFPFALIRLSRSFPRQGFVRAFMSVKWNGAIHPAGFDIRFVQVFLTSPQRVTHGS